MTKKAYVGNSGYEVAQADLEHICGAHGTVESADIITDRASGPSKAFAFVEMSSEAEAQAATEALDGQDCADRELKVNQAKPRPFGGGRGYHHY